MLVKHRPRQPERAKCPSLPDAGRNVLPRGQMVRWIALLHESEPTDSQEEWSRLTAEQFLFSYSEADAIYDNAWA